jgi:hypothetical protein
MPLLHTNIWTNCDEERHMCSLSLYYEYGTSYHTANITDLHSRGTGPSPNRSTDYHNMFPSSILLG